MLDKEILNILDAFKKNTLDVEAMTFEENSYHIPSVENKPIQINSENILPGIGNVGDLNTWTNS